MSESHQMFKHFKKLQEQKEKAVKRNSKYVESYEKDERIARFEWKEKEREEDNDRDRTDKLFGNIY